MPCKRCECCDCGCSECSGDDARWWASLTPEQQARWKPVTQEMMRAMLTSLKAVDKRLKDGGGMWHTKGEAD